MAGVMEDYPQIATVEEVEALAGKLARERVIAVDAKTSIDGYLDALDAKDEAKSEELLERYSDSVLEQARRLANKQYWKHFDRSPELVVMFIPGDQLVDVTRECMLAGVEQARPGNRVRDIGRAIDPIAARNGFSVVRAFVGHGIGEQLHEEPQVPNFGAPGRRERLVSGMVLAIEPMVNAGSPAVELSAADGWTARTRDGSRSAHFEVCVAVTDGGPRVLGGPLKPAAGPAD